MPRVGFFPGSTIGNFEPLAAVSFLRNAARILGEGATLIIGVDLVKDEKILHAAYNDAEGVTAAFNLNLLARINREAGADFDIEAFEHRAFFNTARERIEMHLVSRTRQTVTVGAERFEFEPGETIHTENSYKYTRDGFRDLARQAGWLEEALWTDPAGNFSVRALKGEKLVQRFSIQNTSAPSLCSLAIKRLPVSRSKFGMSMAARGSVHSIVRRSPALSAASAFSVFSAGSGHFRPFRSRLVSLIERFYIMFAIPFWAIARLRLKGSRMTKNKTMRIIGLAGWSGAGKTTLLAKLIPALIARGLKVSTVKHAHHNFDVDKPGKDSHVHREAGATEVFVASANRWALMHELRGEAEISLGEIVAKNGPGRSCDRRGLQAGAASENRNSPRRSRQAAAQPR